MKTTLAIDYCPKHGFYSVSVNTLRADGFGGGTRLTGGKCCGSWSTFREWTMTPEQLRDAANELLEYAAKAEETK